MTQHGLKYAPIGELLRGRAEAELLYSLDDLDGMVRDGLPPSARNKYAPQFWSNPTAYSRTRRQWLDEGYHAYFVPPNHVRFQKIRDSAPSGSDRPPTTLHGLFEILGAEYTDATLEGDGAFEGSQVVYLVTKLVPQSIREALGDSADAYRIKGSAGQSKWTDVPWVALLRPALAASVQEGIYLVYLLSRDGSRLYLSLNQGCTSLYKEKKMAAAEELRRRGAVVRDRVSNFPHRLSVAPIDLAARGWRAQLYQDGHIYGFAYDTANLPSDSELKQDLMDALTLYGLVEREGGWTPTEVIVAEAADDGLPSSVNEAKKYRIHRSLERDRKIVAKVKRLKGFVCEGCDRTMGQTYGSVVKNFIHAHHKRPISSYGEGEVVTLNPIEDFAVLCPNCHAVIHRMDDASDISALRELIAQSPH